MESTLLSTNIKGDTEMISFIEKEPFVSGATSVTTVYAPIYMVKASKEYFVRNRVLDYKDPLWHDYELKKSEREVAEIKEFLTRTDGKYFKFNGSFEDPFEMLQDMKNHGHTFTHPDDLFIDRLNEHGRYFDFHGNRKEVSAAFHYRIYDRKMAQKLQQLIREENFT